MLLLDYIAIAIVALLFLGQYRFPNFLRRHERRIYLGVIAIVAGTLIYQVHTEFIELINSAPPTRYYGPPYTSISFFLFSGWSRIVGPYLLSVLVSALALWGMRMPSRYQDRFEAGEPYLIATSIVLLRHPFWMLYVLVGIVSYVLVSLYQARQRGSATRVSFYKIWLPLAFIVLVAIPLLVTITGLDVISFANLH